MTSGELIEWRLQNKLCIKCGVHYALDWPYICPDCQKAIAEEDAAKRRNGPRRPEKAEL